MDVFPVSVICGWNEWDSKCVNYQWQDRGGLLLGSLVRRPAAPPWWAAGGRNEPLGDSLQKHRAASGSTVRMC